MQIRTRHATESDVPFLLALRRATMDPYLVRDGVSMSEREHLERVMYRFDRARIIEVDDQAMGLLKLVEQWPDWEVLQVQISPAVQGRGIGQHMMETVIKDAAGNGAGIRLGVLKSNPARRLYERLGFLVISEDELEYQMHRPVDSPFR